MAKYYGDIPCVKLSKIHITISARECLCGTTWLYGAHRTGKASNLIYRDLDGVTCEKCKEIYNKEMENTYESYTNKQE